LPCSPPKSQEQHRFLMSSFLLSLIRLVSVNVLYFCLFLAYDGVLLADGVVQGRGGLRESR
jgi:hypothetical protein